MRPTPRYTRPIIDAEAPIVPIADALSALRGPAGEDSGVPGIATRAAPADPVQVLAWTLDLAGSIELDTHLSEGSIPPGRDRPDAEGVHALRQRALERFDRLEGAIHRRLVELAVGRSKLWAGDRLFDLLRREGALGGRRARATPGAASQACDAYGLVVANLLERIRGESRSLRLDLGPRIAALGETARQLEAFDALLLRARHRYAHELHARIVPEIARQYAMRLDLALRECPSAPTVDDMEPWSDPSGWIAAFHGDVSRLVMGVLQRERATLDGLMDSLAELAEDSDSPDARRRGGQA